MQLAHESAYDAILTAVERRDHLDAAIAVMAADSEHTPVVTRLGYLRGVSTLITFGLVVETGDWQRLTKRSIGAYLGLVPTEHPSAEHGRRDRSPRPAIPIAVSLRPWRGSPSSVQDRSGCRGRVPGTHEAWRRIPGTNRRGQLQSMWMFSIASEWKPNSSL